MDKESFLDTIRQQYAEDIHEAYLQCEHEDGRNVDFARLQTLLGKLMKNAKVDGLPVKDFEDLVRSTLPQIVDKLELSTRPKAA